jgi:Fur family transcriptional regulator, peroxide stress response regulator
VVTKAKTGKRRSQAELNALHDAVALRMASERQRYTTGRRQLIEALFHSPRPMDMAAIVREATDLPQSSAYRSLAIFTSLGITQRIAGTDESGHYELSEEFVGQHHHHALCQSCGRVVDIESSPKLERALKDAALAAGEQSGFSFDAHRIDLVGTCSACA